MSNINDDDDDDSVMDEEIKKMAMELNTIPSTYWSGNGAHDYEFIVNHFSNSPLVEILRILDEIGDELYHNRWDNFIESREYPKKIKKAIDIASQYAIFPKDLFGYLNDLMNIAIGYTNQKDIKKAENMFDKYFYQAVSWVGHELDIHTIHYDDY